MPRLREWLRGILSGARDNDSGLKPSEPAIPAGLPALPKKRKHLITPSPSCDNLTQSGTPNGAFFKRIPRELRDQIYIAAFGDRTVHMDLRFQRPRVCKAPCVPAHHQAHAQVGTDSGDIDHNAQPVWAWWSCVCHRHPLGEPWNDQCQIGSPRGMCDAFYPGEWPGKCFLGVMGWLLSCRQA